MYREKEVKWKCVLSNGMEFTYGEETSFTHNHDPSSKDFVQDFMESSQLKIVYVPDGPGPESGFCYQFKIKVVDGKIDTHTQMGSVESFKKHVSELSGVAKKEFDNLPSEFKGLLRKIDI